MYLIYFTAIQTTPADITQLKQASLEGNLETVRELLSNTDVNINHLQVSKNHVCLYFHNNIIDTNKFDICVQAGNTALMLASSNGHINIVKYLIENIADINIKDNVSYLQLYL